MAYFENSNLTVQLENDEKPQFNTDFYFTSKDLIELEELLLKLSGAERIRYNIKDLVNFFNNKYSCNQFLKMLKELVDLGIPVIPKLNFTPITEACKVVNGKFKISDTPFNMNGFYFVNNLLLMKYEDGTNDFFTDVKVDLDTLICDLATGNCEKDRDKINGTVYVTYIVFKQETV